MRRWLPWLILLVWLLPVLWPLAGPGLPRANDHLPHYLRAADFAELWRAGELWPRLSPWLALGFGYPVYNFFPSGAHTLVAVLSLATPDLLTAYKLACALSLWLAAWGAFALGRAHAGEVGGWVAGVAYATSPYLLYDLHIRGSLPETLALGLLPWVLWALHRRATVLAGAALAACVLTHNGVSLQAMPLVLAYAVWQAQPPTGDWRTRLKASLGAVRPLALAALLSAFFWLPALSEASAVQVQRGTLNGAMNFANNFLGLAELVAYPPVPVDPALLNPPVARPLPLAALMLAGLAGLSAWRQRRWPPQAGLWLAGALVGTLLITPLARPVWEAVPLLQLTLFPWRLLGPVALLVALAAAVLMSAALAAHPRPAPWLALALTGLSLAGWPLAAPPLEAVPPQPTRADISGFEVPPDFIGTTTVGEYLPQAVRVFPEPDRAALQAGSPARPLTGAGAQVEPLVQGAFGDTYRVHAAAMLTLTYAAFYFPGWQGWVNGAPVPLTAAEPHGLITLAVPAGTHTVRLAFGDTPARQAGAGLSLAGLGVALAVVLRRRPPATAPADAPASADAPAPILAVVLGMGLAGVAGRALMEADLITPLRQRGAALTTAQPLNQNFADELTLLAWRATPTANAVQVDVFWQANRPLGVAYGFEVRLTDAAGVVWSASAERPRSWRFFPGTDHWPTDQYIQDGFVLPVLPGTPPGEYTVQVTVFAFYNLQAIGQANLPVMVPARWPVAAPALALAEASLNLPQAAPGDTLNVTALWHTPATAVNAPAQVQVLAENGSPVAEASFALAAPAQSQWRQVWPVRLPVTLTTGMYSVHLTTPGRSWPVGSVQVIAPARTFGLPAEVPPLMADLDAVQLVGALWPQRATPGQTVPVTLAWQGQQVLDESFYAFAHLTTAEGQLVAQSDGVPARWSRPTTGWLPGEVVRDDRELSLPPTLPPGTYTLWAGLYTLPTGQRLTSPAFPDGRVPLGTLTINR